MALEKSDKDKIYSLEELGLNNERYHFSGKGESGRKKSKGEVAGVKKKHKWR